MFEGPAETRTYTLGTAGHVDHGKSALVRALHTRQRLVFLQVFKTNEAATACYERLGFQTVRTMVLARCQL